MKENNSLENIITRENLKVQYLILELGRKKESYQYYFYNKQGVDLNTFIIDIKKSIKKAAHQIYNRNATSPGGKISDYDLHFEATKLLSDFGYEIFEPHNISFSNISLSEGDFDFDTSMHHFVSEDELRFDFSSKNDRGVFVFIEWNGIDYSLIEHLFFKSNNNLEMAYEIVFGYYEEFSLHIKEFKKKNPIFKDNTTNFQDKTNQELTKNFKETITNRLTENGFNLVDFHSAFAYCIHNLSPHLNDIVGNEVYEGLLLHNQNVEANQQNAINDNSRKNNIDDDLPF
jgi:hypothetical protein